MGDRPVVCHPGLPDDLERELAEGWIAAVPSPERAEEQPARLPVARDGEGTGRSGHPDLNSARDYRLHLAEAHRCPTRGLSGAELVALHDERHETEGAA